jgi:hypothetical protein
MKIPSSACFRFSFLRGCVPLVVAGLPAAPGVFAGGWEEGTVRAVAGFSESLRFENTGAAVIGISNGGTFGKNKSSEISFEWLAGSRITRRYDRHDNCVDTSRELHMPVTVNYRYYLRVPRIPAALYAGAGAGVLMISNSFSPGFYTIDSDPETGKANGWLEFFKRFDYAVTAAGTLGVAINLSSRASMDVGVRWAWQSGSWHTFDSDTDVVNERERTVWTHQDYTRMVMVSAHWTY